MEDPKQVDRYEIRGVLGRGAMGSVFLAWDPKLHREVAVKVVSPKVPLNSKIRERFHREARAIAALRHPNIVEIYDYAGGSDTDQLYLVMEKLDGDDLFNIVNDKGMMPEPAAAAAGHELCAALEVAHEAGIIHRDLKPENVFMNSAGRVVLTDFGVVKAVNDQAVVDGWSQPTDIIGTPGFMAPELMMNKPLGPRTDIFALGATLYNVATGEMPYEGTTPVDIFRNVVAGNYIDPRSYVPALSVEFCEILEKSMHPKPKQRYDTVRQMREALKTVVELNGVADMRDDLRDYMGNAKQYAQAAKKRAVDYLVQRTKIAVKDGDHAKVARYRDRIYQLDPQSKDLDAITGIIPLDAIDEARRSTSRTSRAKKPGNSARLLYIMVGLLVVAALGMAGYIALQKPEQRPLVTAPDDVPDDEPPPIAPVRATLTMVIKGPAAVVLINGKRVGRFTKRDIDLDAGRHNIEVRSRRGRVRRKVSLDPGQQMMMTVDPRRKQVSFE